MLRMATRNDAKALGIDAGFLKPGKKADIIVLDLTKNQMFTPLLKDITNRKIILESHLVYGCNGSAAQHSIIDGLIVMKDFRVLAVDEGQLRKSMGNSFEGLAEDMKSFLIDSRAVMANGNKYSFLSSQKRYI
ncbi:hypothetical protein MAP00_005168 [Monascus purpureus]|nr:hypothetical protein MAP00_005168 [Monascus purpureus]